jgi:dihydropteroate synthase
VRILAISHRQDLNRELAAIQADAASWDIFADKSRIVALKLEAVSTATANILKQTALAAGADCAVHRLAASGRVRTSDAILFATPRQLDRICEHLKSQPECVARLVPEMEALRTRCAGYDLTVMIDGKKVDLGARTYVMGVLNVTPDSFSDGGQYVEPEAAFERALEMEAEGADFIDVGAESTRPGSNPVPAEEQLRRLRPVLRLMRKQVKLPVSVDTTSAHVAEAALAEGAAMVNDVSGLGSDRRMAKVVARSGVPCVIMHMKGRPRTMQRKPAYRDMMADIVGRLGQAVAHGERFGVERSQMIVDPGIGFGKGLEHNYEILRRLSELESLGRPILVGPSRKRFIGETLGAAPDERVEGTVAACVVAAEHGANIVRVHDVKPVVRALKLADAVAGRR